VGSYTGAVGFALTQHAGWPLRLRRAALEYPEVAAEERSRRAKANLVQLEGGIARLASAMLAVVGRSPANEWLKKSSGGDHADVD
jgi:hypothetical protein